MASASGRSSWLASGTSMRRSKRSTEISAAVRTARSIGASARRLAAVAATIESPTPMGAAIASAIRTCSDVSSAGSSGSSGTPVRTSSLSST